MKSCLIYSNKSALYESNLSENESQYGLKGLEKLFSNNNIQFIDSKNTTIKEPKGDYIVIVDDDYEDIGKLLNYSSECGEIDSIIVCTDADSVHRLLSLFNKEPDLITLDFQLRDDGNFIEETSQLYSTVKKKWNDIPVIGITNFESQTHRDGIAQLIALINKNWDSVYDKRIVWSSLPTILRDKIRISRLNREKEQLATELSKAQGNLNDLKKTLGIDLKTRTESSDFATLQDPLIGNSLKMKELRFHIELAAKDKGNVLLLGETGTGKELVAKAIHKLSGKNKEIVIVNCAAIPETLIESELFGVVANYHGFHNKTEKVGFFEQAKGSTLFLDEIHHMSLSAQAKVLRAIDDKKFYKLGGEKPIELGDDTRILAATKPNIEELIEAGNFLEDLFGRLNSFMPILPTLSERTDDILELIEYFLLAKKSNLVLTSDAKDVIVKHSWKRNVRELRNFIFGLNNLYSGTVNTMKNLGSIPRQTIIDKEHIEYALSLHDKKSSDEKIIRQIIVGDELLVSNAAKKYVEPNAKLLLSAILNALQNFNKKAQVTLVELAQQIVMPGKGNKGTAGPHLSSEFSKYKSHFKELMSSNEFSDKLQLAMKYRPLKNIITS
ncbi:MAG TPA: hypothetical protein DHV28_07635 [Ignavibacteriales bacterium]|nr:hypothetical protein [Ignavibacteriales bacterium]